jgi:hypothetical protein
MEPGWFVVKQGGSRLESGCMRSNVGGRGSSSTTASQRSVQHGTHRDGTSSATRQHRTGMHAAHPL